ncbi:hypothetical protein B0H16DRAFT_678344 [Mycena metata]|uniref:Uncharacterized protein n=1 Tax=Mycena metata TaxID=1033252 RepID=A0AAD7NEM7_9AGAR|nr:hypothetical protein B0H16DRAFT_678344 [Mycena metata]
MSQRRLNRTCGKSKFTIFVLGLGRCSIPMVVTENTLIDDIYSQLSYLKLVPTIKHPNLYFLASGQTVPWRDSLWELNLGPDSQLDLRISVPGGASETRGSPEVSLSKTPCKPSGSGSNSVIVVESDHEPAFDPKEWIGTGKLYRDIPSYVADVYRAVREIPSTLVRKLPNRDLPVADFLALTLPRILADDMTFPRRTSSWFSTENPNCEPDTVWSSVVPPLWFLRDLESIFPQAWLNGAQSIVDPNNSW